MDWDRVFTLIIVVGGLSTALSPIVTAFVQARGKRDETLTEKEKIRIEKEKTAQEGYDRLTDQLQETIERLDKKIKEQESERALIINELKIRGEESDRKDRAIENLEKDLEEAHHQIAVVEETNRLANIRIDGMLKKQETKINGAENMAKEAKKNTDELEKKLAQTGALDPKNLENKKTG